MTLKSMFSGLYEGLYRSVICRGLFPRTGNRYRDRHILIDREFHALLQELQKRVCVQKYSPRDQRYAFVSEVLKIAVWYYAMTAHSPKIIEDTYGEEAYQIFIFMGHIRERGIFSLQDYYRAGVIVPPVDGQTPDLQYINQYVKEKGQKYASWRYRRRSKPKDGRKRGKKPASGNKK